MAFDTNRLDAAFTALMAFDWGTDPAPLAVIDEAVVAAHGDRRLAADLENRFHSALAGGTSRAGKEYVCRRLAVIGSAASVAGLARLLDDPEQSHMARFALERIDAAEAGAALRAALHTTTGVRRIGVISSLVGRGDADCVPLLCELLGGEQALAVAAAEGLGRLASPAAAAGLAAAKPGPADDAILDARLACADAFLARGERTEARAIYDAIATRVGDSPASHRDRALRIAAVRGRLACLDRG